MKRLHKLTSGKTVTRKEAEKRKGSRTTALEQHRIFMFMSLNQFHMLIQMLLGNELNVTRVLSASVHLAPALHSNDFGSVRYGMVYATGRQSKH